jgi:hypothetical protein
MRFIVGGAIFGVILSLEPGLRSGPASIAAGVLAVFALAQLGPRSIVEKVGLLMTASMIAWVAGPSPARGASLFSHLSGWLAASTALAIYVHPRGE